MQSERLSEGFLAAMLTPAALTYHLHQLRELQRLSSSNRSKTHLENILAFISSSSTGSFTSFFWACITDQTLKEINAKYSTVCPYSPSLLPAMLQQNLEFCLPSHTTRMLFWKKFRTHHEEVTSTGSAPTARISETRIQLNLLPCEWEKETPGLGPTEGATAGVYFYLLGTGLFTAFRGQAQCPAEQDPVQS